MNIVLFVLVCVGLVMILWGVGKYGRECIINDCNLSPFIWVMWTVGFTSLYHGIPKSGLITVLLLLIMLVSVILFIVSLVGCVLDWMTNTDGSKKEWSWEIIFASTGLAICLLVAGLESQLPIFSSSVAFSVGFFWILYKTREQDLFNSATSVFMWWGAGSVLVTVGSFSKVTLTEERISLCLIVLAFFSPCVMVLWRELCTFCKKLSTDTGSDWNN